MADPITRGLQYEARGIGRSTAKNMRGTGSRHQEHIANREDEFVRTNATYARTSPEGADDVTQNGLPGWGSDDHENRFGYQYRGGSREKHADTGSS